MGVYNGESALQRTLDSLRAQTFTDWELIAVDDASSDRSLKILDAYAEQDERIRVLRQEANKGLTQALIRGCSEARGEFIARQDVGDVSVPDRLQIQQQMLKASPLVSLLSCRTQVCGPHGEILDTAIVNLDAEDATRQLRTTNLERIAGVSHHGSAMFRAADYRKAGGYRGEFYFAQDLDLWLRLTDHGHMAFCPEVLYCSRISESCISSVYRDQQLATAELIVEAFAARSAGIPEGPILLRAQAIRPVDRLKSRTDKAKGNYWIGRMLQRRGDVRCLSYLFRSFLQNPAAWKALASLLIAPPELLLHRFTALRGTQSKETSVEAS